MNKNIRDRMIYKQYNQGINIELIAKSYDLKPSTIQNIVYKYRKTKADGDKFIEDMYSFMKEKHSTSATLIYHSLHRYFDNNNIINKKDRLNATIRIIQGHIKIRNISEKSCKIIKEFIDTYN